MLYLFNRVVGGWAIAGLVPVEKAAAVSKGAPVHRQTSGPWRPAAAQQKPVHGCTLRGGRVGDDRFGGG
ncbi:hypothetical protein [Nitrosomonas halophila]|uniref:hypothetical protein n=1 Tax=Nitrosomonas halophila TaxID=44576 RepID=UPI00115FD59D|nr:hypothetical protein [Nitrosomonas halophila]